jgi:hypothetical protein
MNHPGDKKSQAPSKEGTTEPSRPAGDPRPGDNRSGRIAYDERGNSVWEWQLETGVYSRDISTQRLKKLEFNDLSIAETAKHQRPAGLGDSPGKQPVPGSGFNPYDNSSTVRGNVGSNPYNSGGQPTLKPESAAPRKPMDLKKLEEWIAIRKRVQQNRQEDEDE